MSCELVKCIKLLQVAPITTATTQRLFSALRLLINNGTEKTEELDCYSCPQRCFWMNWISKSSYDDFIFCNPVKRQMEWLRIKLCFLIMWSVSVTAQNGYVYLKPETSFSRNPQEPQSVQYFQTTNRPTQGYNDGTSFTTPQSSGLNISSTISPEALFGIKDRIPQSKGIINIPDRVNIQTRYPTRRPSLQGFDQAITSPRLLPGIATQQSSISQPPQYNNQINEQNQGISGFPAYPEGIDSRRYTDVTSLTPEVYDEGDYSAIPGLPGVDYPIYADIPSTSFQCEQQFYPGYYADVETQCQVFHICANNRTYDFLCPNGTIFHQEYLVCVWWNTFDCNSAPALYSINAYIYNYSLKQPKNVFYNTQTIGDEQIPQFTNISRPVAPSGPGRDYFQVSSFPDLFRKGARFPDRINERYPDNVNPPTGIPGTSRYQYTVPSGLPDSQRPDATSSSRITPTTPGYSTGGDQFYSYPREDTSRYVGGLPGSIGVTPSYESGDSFKATGYPIGIPQGRIGQSTSKSPEYYTDQYQRPELTTEYVKLSNTAVPFSGQPPRREYLPPTTN